jgi:diguanylate cyclase (GGDEF)-like protein
VAAWRRSIATGKAYDVEYRMRSGNGAYRWVHARAYPRLDGAGQVMTWYGASENIHARKLAQRRMNWTATHDSLTGLANRRHFRDQFKAAIDRTGGRSRVALLLIDLDGFKLVNDRHGHDVGDELLVATARRLRRVVGRRGLVSRLGGDEFTIILPRFRNDEWLAGFAEQILQALNGDLRLSGVEIEARASIGIAIYPDDNATVSACSKTRISRCTPPRRRVAGAGCGSVPTCAREPTGSGKFAPQRWRIEPPRVEFPT